MINTNGVQIVSGFELNAKQPLDTRQVVDRFSDLDRFDDVQKYAGMFVYVLEHDIQYRLSNKGEWLPNSFGFISKSTDPDNNRGVNGFLFLNNITGDLFQKQIVLAEDNVTQRLEWVKLFKIKGEKGDRGDRGDKGSRGNIWIVGNKISGGTTVADTIFNNSGVTVKYGDKYLNEVTCDVYECRNDGNPDIATWTYVCNIKGLQGIQGEKGIRGSRWFDSVDITKDNCATYTFDSSTSERIIEYDYLYNPTTCDVFKYIKKSGENYKYIGNLRPNDINISETKPTDPGVKVWIKPESIALLKPNATIDDDSTTDKYSTWSTRKLSNIVTTLQRDVQQLFQKSNDSKRLIANAIIGKGVQVSENDTFEEMANKISSIRTTNPDANFKADDLLIGKKAVDSTGTLISGLMLNRGAIQDIINIDWISTNPATHIEIDIPSGAYIPSNSNSRPKIRISKDMINKVLGIDRNKFLSTTRINNLNGSIPLWNSDANHVATAQNNEGFGWDDDSSNRRGRMYVLKIPDGHFINGISHVGKSEPDLLPENIVEGKRIGNVWGNAKIVRSGNGVPFFNGATFDSRFGVSGVAEYELVCTDQPIDDPKFYRETDETLTSNHYKNVLLENPNYNNMSNIITNYNASSGDDTPQFNYNRSFIKDHQYIFCNSMKRDNDHKLNDILKSLGASDKSMCLKYPDLINIRNFIDNNTMYYIFKEGRDDLWGPLLFSEDILPGGETLFFNKAVDLKPFRELVVRFKLVGLAPNIGRGSYDKLFGGIVLRNTNLPLPEKRTIRAGESFTSFHNNNFHKNPRSYLNHNIKYCDNNIITRVGFREKVSTNGEDFFNDTREFRINISDLNDIYIFGIGFSWIGYNIHKFDDDNNYSCYYFLPSSTRNGNRIKYGETGSIRATIIITGIDLIV